MVWTVLDIISANDRRPALLLGLLSLVLWSFKAFLDRLTGYSKGKVSGEWQIAEVIKKLEGRDFVPCPEPIEWLIEGLRSWHPGVKLYVEYQGAYSLLIADVGGREMTYIALWDPEGAEITYRGLSRRKLTVA